MLLTIMNTGDAYLQFMKVLLIFVFVLVIAYLVTKWIAKYQKEQNINRNIRVVETCRLTGNKYIQIIQAGDKYLAIAVCKDTITMLTEIPAQQLQLSQDRAGGSPSFKEILDRMKKSGTIGGAEDRKPDEREE